MAGIERRMLSFTCQDRGLSQRGRNCRYGLDSGSFQGIDKCTATSPKVLNAEADFFVNLRYPYKKTRGGSSLQPSLSLNLCWEMCIGKSAVELLSRRRYQPSQAFISPAQSKGA
jgi:hypothetical protein